MDEAKYKRLIEVADFFNKSARALLTVDGRLHAETLILSVGRMAGSLMFRSFAGDKNIPPGTVVLSDAANIHGPKLMQVMFATLAQLGDQVGENDLDPAYMSADHAQLNFKESHERLAPFFLKYCEAGSMNFYDAAVAAAIAAGILAHDCREVLAVNRGAALAVYGFVEGTKTAPFPVSPGVKRRSPSPPPEPEPKKPWYKFW